MPVSASGADHHSVSGEIAETRTTQAPTAESARGEPPSVRIGDVPTWRAHAVLKVLAEP